MSYPADPVLLVDDERQYLQSASFALRSSGISNVVKCQDSREVEKLLAEKTFSVIVLDNLMPFINGVELLPGITKKYPNTPVLMLTAINEIDTAVECMKLGAFDYMVKPVEKARFVNGVKHALEYRDIKQKNQDLTESLLRANSELEDRAKKQDELLRKISRTSQQLRTILDTSREVVLLAGPRGNILEANINMQAFFGVEAADMLNKSLDQFFDAIQHCFEDGEKFRAIIEKTKLAGPASLQSPGPHLDFTSILRLIKPVERFINVSSLAVGGDGSVNLGSVWTFTDFTTLVRADAQLHTIVEAAPIPVLISSLKDGRVIFANKNLAQMAGLTGDEIIGRYTKEFYWDPGERESLMAELKSQGFIKNRELKLRQPDGGYIWTLISLVASKLNDENVIVGGIYDISQQKEALHKAEKARQNLLETQSRLVQSEKMAALGNLVAGIAHEINNPVGAVKSAADSAGRGIVKISQAMQNAGSLDDLKGHPAIEKILHVIGDSNNVIREGSDRIAKIVKSLKNFSRIDEAEYQEADIHEGLESTLILVHHELKNRIQVVRNYGQVPRINCYPNQLNQVFMNLFVNAGHAIGDRGEIAIQTASDGKYVYVKISDTGKGIPPENLEKVFDPGFTTKGVGVGTGLGLSICYNIINKHKGEISVESEVGKGSAFSIKLPIAGETGGD